MPGIPRRPSSGERALPGCDFLWFLGLSAHGDTCGLRKRRHFKAWYEHFKAKEGEEGLLTPVEKQSLSPKVEERQLPGSNIDGGDVQEE